MAIYAEDLGSNPDVAIVLCYIYAFMHKLSEKAHTHKHIYIQTYTYTKTSPHKTHITQ